MDEGNVRNGIPSGEAMTERREDPALEALRQWEIDTGKPASASKGNTFIDGYQAALLRPHVQCAIALRKLCNEVLGLLGIAREEIRQAVGNTNFSVLQQRLDEAWAALPSAPGETK